MKKGRVVVIGIICIVLVVGLYYFFSKKDVSSGENQEEVTEVQKVILKDLSGDGYPATPREVIKFYNRIICCYYNDDYTEEEFKKLAEQARCLLDQELLDNNPEEQYYLNVQSDVEDYQNRSKTISNASVCDSNDIVYDTVDGAECAYVISSYFVREEKNFFKTNQRYILRKDDEGRWKILAFELVEGDTEDNE